MLCVRGSMPAGSAHSSAAALARAGVASQTAVCTCNGWCKGWCRQQRQADMLGDDVSDEADVRSAAETRVELTGLHDAVSQQRQ
jgi:hypothetical protein